ncbi:hypothetical protein V496_00610 [Pseudogymnoascus sp. VKM F-4515 (FW-2607)]|nr:hypothetical protein V496_00610 [Pseudogymnoascus sp. VKM F-4515 (FW-2607)]
MYSRRRKQYLSQQIKVADEWLSQLGEQVKSCEGRIKSCEEKSNIAEERISRLEYQMKESEGQIQTFEEHGNIANSYGALSGAQDQFISAQKERIFDLEEAVVRSISLSQSLSDTVASQDTTIRELQAQIIEFATSNSYRDATFCQNLGLYGSLELETYDKALPGTRTPSNC